MSDRYAVLRELMNIKEATIVGSSEVVASSALSREEKTEMIKELSQVIRKHYDIATQIVQTNIDNDGRN